jgi:hypothetical protein
LSHAIFNFLVSFFQTRSMQKLLIRVGAALAFAMVIAVGVAGLAEQLASMDFAGAD